MLATQRTRYFAVTEAMYAAGALISTHIHDTPSLTLVISGAFVEKIGSDTLDCDERSILIKPPHILHENSFPADSRVILIEPLPEGGDSEILDLFARAQRVHSPLARPVALRVWSELHRRDSLNRLVIDGKLFELAADLLRTRDYSVAPSRIRKALDIIHDTPEESLDVAVLADAAGLPVRAFLKRFRAETGCGVAEYTRRVRIERAKRRLLDREIDLKALALELGYYDQSHFTNSFRKHVGMTPSEYRRSPV